MVINYDLPYPKKYIQRVGFGGRPGNNRIAVNLATDKDIDKLREIERFYKIEIDEMPQNFLHQNRQVSKSRSPMAPLLLLQPPDLLTFSLYRSPCMFLRQEALILLVPQKAPRHEVSNRRCWKQPRQRIAHYELGLIYLLTASRRKLDEQIKPNVWQTRLRASLKLFVRKAVTATSDAAPRATTIEQINPFPP